MSTSVEIDAATGGYVTVTQLCGPDRQPMVELTAIVDYDWPVRLSLDEAEAVHNALGNAIARTLS